MGTPPQAPPPPPPGAGPGLPQQQGNPGLAIAGFVVGLIGLLLFWFTFVGLVVSIIGLILSIIGRRQAVERGAPTGLATAGLICSIIGVAAGLIFTILVIAILEEADDELVEFNDALSTTTDFDFNGVVIGLWMLRDRLLQPIRSLRS